MSKKIEIEESSDNVFADIGLPKPEERLAKADLAIRITEAIRARRLTQTRAAPILKIDQPKISRLLRGLLHRAAHALLNAAWPRRSDHCKAPRRR